MRKAAIPLTLAALAAAMDAGCAPRDNSVVSSPLFSAVELAEFMGTREERAARAPYSPPGWPLQRGDTISDARLRELKREFGHYCGEIRAPFWVGDMVFGAGFRSSVPDDVIIVGALPGDHIVDTVARWGTKAHPSQVHRRNLHGPPPEVPLESRSRPPRGTQSVRFRFALAAAPSCARPRRSSGSPERKAALQALPFDRDNELGRGTMKPFPVFIHWANFNDSLPGMDSIRGITFRTASRTVCGRSAAVPAPSARQRAGVPEVLAL